LFFSTIENILSWIVVFHIKDPTVFNLVFNLSSRKNQSLSDAMIRSLFVKDGIKQEKFY